MARLALLANRWFLRNKANKWFCVSCETWNRVSIRRIRHQPPLGVLVSYMPTQAFCGPFKKHSRTEKLKPKENYSKLKQKTQGFGKYEEGTRKIDSNKGEDTPS